MWTYIENVKLHVISRCVSLLILGGLTLNASTLSTRSSMVWRLSIKVLVLVVALGFEKSIYFTDSL